MLCCLAVEAASLPRLRSQPLPSSLRSPPLHGTCIAQGFVSGDSKLPVPCSHAPAPQPRLDYLTRWQAKEKPGKQKRFLGWGNVGEEPITFSPQLSELEL